MPREPQIESRLDQGLALLRGGRLGEARAIALALLAAAPDDADALRLLGQVALRAGEAGRAAELMARVVALGGDVGDRFGLALALSAAGRIAEALAAYDEVVILQPDFAEAHNNRGSLLMSDGRLDEALASYEAAIAARPDFALAHRNQALTLRRLGRPAEALVSLDAVLAVAPEEWAACLEQGHAFADLGRFEEAMGAYDRVLALRPDLAEVWDSLGNAQLALGRPQDALASYDRALALRPDFAGARQNRGTALVRLNRRLEAIESYQRAAALDPSLAEARYHEALARLALGDFEEGWRLHEHRKETSMFRRLTLGPAREWTGAEDISAATLLVYSEQGLGDALQFSRFLADAHDRCRRLVFLAPERLSGLLRRNFPNVDVVGTQGPLPAFDWHCALMSLPLALGLTDEQRFARGVYLAADAELAARWTSRLGPRTGPRLGIAWRGAPTHPDDRNRSIELARLAPLLVADADWVALQKDLAPGEAETLSATGVAWFGDDLADFDDTAALVGGLDLVISVDTSVAHLAGALGRPVWVLLPFSPDWRWGLARTDSPWHPTARLFRQPSLGDWGPVIEAVRGALAGDV